MDKTFIKDLIIRAIIGVRDWERDTPQDILINIVVFTDPRPIDTPDNLSVCVDYSTLAKEIRALVEKARRYTVEALAEDIAGICLSRSLVCKVMVRVEKPGAVTDAGAVGVEIERSRI